MDIHRPCASTTGALAACLLFAACGDASGPGDGPPEAITELPRALSPVESELITASNDFGIRLLQEVVSAEEAPNVVLSPLSASVALGMTLNGADGETLDAMRETLGYGEPEQEAINSAYRTLLSLLVDLDPGVEFTVANSLWADEGFPFHEDFMARVQAEFDAVARTLDLQGPEALNAINGWVNEETRGYIPALLEEIDPELVLFLINAIYFESTWTRRFDPGLTATAPFRTEAGGEVSVELMSMPEPEVPYAWRDGYAAVGLPYSGQAFGMVVILPDEGASARDLLAALDAEALADLEGALTESSLSELRLPRFELSYGTRLDSALKAMGMAVAFDSRAANFDRMSPDPRLYIHEVRQKTFLEVDEAGTRAAAATSVGVGVESAPPSFVVDRPFLFVLRERLTGAILFIGLVGDPTAGD